MRMSALAFLVSYRKVNEKAKKKRKYDLLQVKSRGNEGGWLLLLQAVFLV